ncbi:hypothetical protein V500_03466 [Pseudogymnoascus sp. VKM F-4518 (FW-2643)]|nr:hypothetical protein V500_03466 [Pseudogymnoascus sp. VKM F-4518 (FW-2643)]
MKPAPFAGLALGPTFGLPLNRVNLASFREAGLSAGQAKNAVAGVAGVEQLRDITDDAPTSVGRRVDDRSHCEYVVRKQTVKLRGSGTESRK